MNPLSPQAAEILRQLVKVCRIKQEAIAFQMGWFTSAMSRFMTRRKGITRQSAARMISAIETLQISKTSN